MTDVDNDYFVNDINSFLALIDDSTIINTIISALDTLKELDEGSKDVVEFREMVKLYSYNLDESLDVVKNYAKNTARWMN